MRLTRSIFRLVATGAALGLAGCDQDVMAPANRPAATAAPVWVASASGNVVACGECRRVGTNCGT